MIIGPSYFSYRCRQYELDQSQPKRWQYFETVYDENSAKDEARMGRLVKMHCVRFSVS